MRLLGLGTLPSPTILMMGNLVPPNSGKGRREDQAVEV